MSPRFTRALAAWGTPIFDTVFKESVNHLDAKYLPLQQALSQTSYVADRDFSIVVLSSFETPQALQVKTGIFYAGVIAGSCCADDPSPLDEVPEHCEVLFTIDKSTAEIKIDLLSV